MGNWIGVLIIVAMFAVVGVMGYFRIAPTDAAQWHVDPTDLSLSDGPGAALVRGDGALSSPVFDETPEALLARLDAIALATPRTRRIAGSIEEGRVTYMTRSLLFGFPDYTSVTTISSGPSDEGAALVAYGRLRFGSSDMGVNKERLEGWLAQLGR